MTTSIFVSLILCQLVLLGVACVLLIGAHNKLGQSKRVEQDLRKLLLLYKTRSTARRNHRR